MAVTHNWYGNGLLKALTGAIDFDTDTFKVSLHTASYTPNQDTHDFRDDLTNEVTGTGYSAGGGTLSGVSVTYDATSNEVRILWDDEVWTTATITARYAVIYKSRGGAASADELVSYIDFGENVSSTAGNFTIDFTTSALKVTAS